MSAIAAIEKEPEQRSFGPLIDAAEWIGDRFPVAPEIAVVLGSGLGPLVAGAACECSLPYSGIPGFLPPTAEGHAGRLTCARFEETPVLLLEGRSHLYEGVSAAEATWPIRVLAQLGVRTLILTNATGGLHPNLRVGDIVVLEDGLNFMGARTSVRGAVHGGGAPRLFDARLRAWGLEAAREAGIPAFPGVYAAVTGPNYETRAEQRMYRMLGADVIGMSTMPEAAVAVECGLKVLGLSTVTNCCRPDAPQPTDGAAVVHAAGDAAAHVLAIIQGVIRRL